MKLLVQGDDFGFTRGVTLGIVDSIDRGILRNTGLFANMPAAEFAVSFMKDRPQACFGIDFNLVAGKPVSKPEEVPHLVDENGYFIKSGVRMRNELWATEEGRRQLFPKEEVVKEIRAQYERFIALAGNKPGYLHAHSIMPEPYLEAIHELSEETGIPFSMELWKKQGLFSPKMSSPVSKTKVFEPHAQLDKDTTQQIVDGFEDMLQHEKCVICCHPGYLDAELLDMTSLSIERVRDAQAYMSDVVNNWVKDNHVELITYRDLKED